MANKFEDPLWQTALYVGLDPVFRLLHRDRDNVSLWCLGLLSVVCQFQTWYLWGLLWSLLAALGLLTKLYITCGPCVSPYTTRRQYRESYLDVDGDVPELVLNGKSAFDNGFEYGIIMCEEIIYLLNRFKRIVRPNVQAWVLKDINNSLPDNIRDEIRGMYEAIDSVYMNEVTYWDILMLQLIPELDSMGCTCYATKDSENNIIFGRNMDWLPFSSAQYSMIVNYKNHGYKSLAVPGLIGCVTAWNSQYALAMNVVGGDYQLDTESLPSTLLNKLVMITANSAKHAVELATDAQPAAPYHLTIASKEDVWSLAYGQGDDGDTHIRKLSDADTNLVVLNWTYPNNDNGRYISQYRNIRTMNQTDKGANHVVNILRQCQTFETMHSLLFRFDSGLSVDIGIDNGFAADQL